MATDIEKTIRQFSKLGIFSHNPQNGIGLWKEEQELLLSLIDESKTYFEIGSHNLGSALLVEQHARTNNIDREVWALDIKFSPWAKLNSERANTEVKMLEMDSSKASKLDDVKDIDFLFIDGYHSFKQVIVDFSGMYPFLSDNAVVAFHDTSPRLNDPEYRQYCLDFVDDNIDFLEESGYEDFYVDEAVVSIVDEYDGVELIDCTTECFHPRETQLDTWIRGKTSPHSAIWAVKVTK